MIANREQGNAVTHMEQLKALFLERGILSVRDPACTGIPFVCFSRLRAQGFIGRIGHGVYSCPAYSSTEFITYAEAAAVAPQGVVCLFSALKIHGLTLENPHRIHLALPVGHRVPKNDLPLDIYHFSGDAYAFGIETVRSPDGDFKVYSVEKTLVDCFKFRNRIGLDVAIAALKDAKANKPIDHAALWKAIRICRMERVMQPYLEGVFS